MGFEAYYMHIKIYNLIHENTLLTMYQIVGLSVQTEKIKQ